MVETVGKRKRVPKFHDEPHNMASSFEPHEIDSILEELLPYRPSLRKAIKKNKYVNKKYTFVKQNSISHEHQKKS